MKICKFFLVVARDDETISDDQLLLKFAEIVVEWFCYTMSNRNFGNVFLSCSNWIIFSKSQRVSRDSQYTRMTFCDLQDEQQDRGALYLHTLTIKKLSSTLKRNLLFQGSIFRWELSVSGRVVYTRHGYSGSYALSGCLGYLAGAMPGIRCGF